MAYHSKFEFLLVLFAFPVCFYSCFNAEMAKEQANKQIEVLIEIEKLNKERERIISTNMNGGQHECLYFQKDYRYNDDFAEKIKGIYTKYGVVDDVFATEEYSLMFNKLVGLIYRDTIFQDKYMYDMKTSFEEGKATGRCYAELTDIIQSSRHNEQIFGTIMGYQSPIIKDLSNLDTRRKKVNLCKYEIAEKAFLDENSKNAMTHYACG